MGKASALFRLPEVTSEEFSTRCGFRAVPLSQTRAGEAGEHSGPCPDTRASGARARGEGAYPIIPTVMGVCAEGCGRGETASGP